MIGWANICRAEDLHSANRLLARERWDKVDKVGKVDKVDNLDNVDNKVAVDWIASNGGERQGWTMNMGHYKEFEIEEMYFFMPAINCSVPITSLYL